MQSVSRYLCIVVIALILGGLSGVTDVQAQYTYRFEYGEKQTLHLDDATARKGYTIEAFDGTFRFGITPDVLTQGGGFEFKKVELLEDSGMETPHGYVRVSDIIEFDIKNKEVYNPAKPFWLQMKYDSDLMFEKFLFYFDQGKGRWVQLPSTTDLQRGIVKAAFHLPYAKLAVFDTDAMRFGKASWYAYKSCMCAASPDYPKGTELLVLNLNADEAIVVTVNDWGPERDVFPDRVIDLDLVAFEKFGSRRIGVLQNIYVAPYHSTDFTDAQNVVLQSGGVAPLATETILALTQRDDEVVASDAGAQEVQGDEIVPESPVTDSPETSTDYYFVN